jgi:DNA repair exonuclease SbcCD ATPase subunit
MMTMSLAQIEAGLAVLKEQYQRAAGQLALLEKQKSEKKAALDRAREDIAVWEQVQFLFTKTSEFAREQLKTRIEETVTAALLAVFGEGYEFKVSVRNLSGQPAAEWQVISRYGEAEVAAGPEDARGGGIVDIVSLALRLSLLELARPKPGGPVILDEPAKMVSAEYLPSVAEFLKQYAARTGRQIILVTHAEPLAEVADVSYRVAQRSGISEVSRA